MDWKKVIQKGIEGAIIGGAGGAITQDMLSTIITATIGFLYKAGMNWFKNKSKNK